jgi:CRISPR-associated protein Cas5
MIDFNHLIRKSEPSEALVFNIKSLCPLSMTSHPGAIYHCSDAPSAKNIYGLLENALGLHYSDEHPIRKALLKKQKVPATKNESKFRTILAPVVHIDQIEITHLGKKFFDYWSRHTKHSDYHAAALPQQGGYSKKLIPLVKAIAEKKITVGGAAQALKDPDAIIRAIEKEETILMHRNVMQGLITNYYSTPTKREYVSSAEYKIKISTTPEIKNELVHALSNPAAPLYLGNSDSWVDCEIIEA